MHGARVIALRGNFDQALGSCASCGSSPDRARQPRQRVPPRGPEDAAFEIVDELGEALDALCIPVGNAGNITAYWKGFQEIGALAPDARLPGRGRGAARDGRRSGTRRRSPARSGSATRRAGRRRWTRCARRAARSGAVTDEEILDAYRCSAARRGLLRAGPARRSPGCSSTAPTARERIVCVLTGHGLKDPQTAIDPPARSSLRRRTSRAVERAVLGYACTGAGCPRPRPSANLGPGFDCSRPRSRSTSSSRSRRPGRSRSTRTSTARATAEPVVRGVRAAAPGRRPHVPDRSEIPLSRRPGLERGGVRRRAGRGRPPVRARRRRARARDRARGPPGQRRGGAARRLRRLRRRRGHALRPPPGWRR